MIPIPKPRFDLEQIEKRWREIWEEEHSFSPDSPSNSKEKFPQKESFSIVIPPPNVTGKLHVGHSLNQTIQDILIRKARKQNLKTLWLPGTDHAGISTQVCVEKELQKENIDRHQIGRKKFIEKVWDWKEKYGNSIKEQQKWMGFSLDWSRERFTMDEGLSRSVRKVFVELYREKLIYRDKKMVHWDPVSKTVLSDLEVEHEDHFQSELYSFAYPISDPSSCKGSSKGTKEIVVSTTRPETMLGDTAVAVHPDDDRYSGLIGVKLSHPLLDRKIPVIADSILVDPKFGTGAVKITPAHDPNDFEAGKRHDLEMISIFDTSARINDKGGKWEGLDRYEARKEIKKELERLGLARGTQAHVMSVGRSQRTGAIIEPIVSVQWFVRTKPLAEKALKMVRSKEVEIIPQQWEHTYFHWMENIRDWCISRQLWWGHRIPVWYGPDGKEFVAENEKEAFQKAKSHYGEKVELLQDEDVLDTWFSSALWPFSTLGWPENTEDLKNFYPTSVLVTSFDIIFFWVARMIMFGVHFMKKPPFRKVYIHGLIRESSGRKMSKTKGNVVDPLLAAQKYGTDAFRFFLIAILSEGKDTIYSEQRLKGYQNFTNKIWNSSRFVLMNLSEDFKPEESKIVDFPLEAEDWWIIERLNEAISRTTTSLDDCKFHLSASYLYSFIWHEFCDWYIELIKPRIFGKISPDSMKAAQQTAYFVLKNSLGLLHPFMPFITEEIHSYLNYFVQKENPQNQTNPKPHILLTSLPWPEPISLPKKTQSCVRSLNLLREAVSASRLIRGEVGLSPAQKISVVIRSDNEELREVFQEKKEAIQRLAGSSEILFLKTYQPSKHDAIEVFSEGEVFVSLEGTLDIQTETKRLHGEIEKLDQQIKTSERRLDNQEFLKKAPQAVSKKEKEKLEEFQAKKNAFLKALKHFQ